MRNPRSLLLVLVWLAACPQITYAQASSSSADLTIEALDNRIDEISNASGTNEATRTALLELYRKAREHIEQRRGFEIRTQEYIRAREEAPKRSDQLRKQVVKLEQAEMPFVENELARAALQELEPLMLSKKAELATLRGQLAELDATLESEAQRPGQVRDRLNQVKTRQGEVDETLKSALAEGETQRLGEARRWALELEARALAAEVEMINQELLSHPMRIELLGAERDLAALNLKRDLAYVENLEALVVSRRQAEAQSVTEEAVAAERQTEGKHPLVQDLAQRNTRLGEELKRQAAELQRITTEENVATERAERVAKNFRLARQKVEIAGLSRALGQVLLEQRGRLPDAREFRTAEKRRQQLVIESSLRQIRNQQERDRLRDLRAYITELVDDLLPPEQDRLRAELQELAAHRRELLDKAIAADDTYLQALGELDFAQRQLSESVTAYEAFLDERLLWIRSGEPPSWQTLQSITRTLAIFVAPSHWLELIQALVVPGAYSWILVAGLVAFLLLHFQAPSMRASLQRSSRNVGQLRHDRYVATLRALAQTLILSLRWPILFAALGLHFRFHGAGSVDLDSQLYRDAEASGQFVSAVGAAFSDIALHTFYFVALRVFCEPAGLAVAHFGWSERLCAGLRRETLRLMWVFLPVVFILVASITYDPAALAGGASRLVFVVVLVALAWFFGRILAPGRGVLAEFYAASPHNPMVWFRYIWLGLGLALPLALAVLATAGFVYTAVQIGTRLVDTLWLIVAIILVHQLVARWVVMTESRLVFKAALQKRRAERNRDRAAGKDTADEAHPVHAEEAEVDYGMLGVETKKLINTILTLLAAFGLWVIWSDVLPAFRILDEVSLWSYSTTVDGASKLVPVTLNDVILSLVIVVVGLIAARRLPALLEILLLARLHISAGSRYAIATLTQYTIVAVGIVLVFNLLGGSWSEIQWLVAALGVGIGFGLQEIVANFICGLILLFERPIRIGDTVTVGETSGVVTRIRIRSTTIRDWDQHELVVPNKEFITGRLLNWTLTDPVTRIMFPVGIAYGSDVARALELVREAAIENAQVLDEPAPMVTFESFGDNALTIMLRCYVGALEHRLPTTSELHQAINRKFEEAGIVIAYPQRDLHLDTSSPLDIRLHPAPAES